MSGIGPSSVKQQKVVDAFYNTQILVIGGAMGGGKSYLMSMLSIPYMDDPRSRVAFFRETNPQLMGSGGLYDTVKSIYSKMSDKLKVNWTTKPPKMTVKSGPSADARIEFISMQHEKSVEDVRGLQFSFIGVDEGTAFSQSKLEMLMSRLRSESKHESKMVISCNPDPDHYICDLIKDYYLDAEGFPIDERAGDVRYFYRTDGDYYWADSREELAKRFDIPKKDEKKKILSFSFVGMTIYDNPDLLESNPGYLAFLEGLSRVEKDRNLHGNWFARAEAEGCFKRQWLRGSNGELVKRLADVPDNCTAMRAVDKAHSIPSEVNPHPDFTALSPLMLKDKEGFYWLLGNYHPKMKDEFGKGPDVPFLGRFRRLAGARDNLIALQMKTDKANAQTYKYSEPKLVLSKDSGAGTGDFNSTIARMAEDGIKVKKDQTISNVKGKKMKDFLGFTSACENGLAYIVEDSFDADTLSYIYKELEKFDGTPSNSYRKDDFVDAFSICYNALASSKRPFEVVRRGPQNQHTLSAGVLDRIASRITRKGLR